MPSGNEGLISLVFSRFSKLPALLRDAGSFVKTLKTQVKLILNCPQAHAITRTNQKRGQNVHACIKLDEHIGPMVVPR